MVEALAYLGVIVTTILLTVMIVFNLQSNVRKN